MRCATKWLNLNNRGYITKLLKYHPFQGDEKKLRKKTGDSLTGVTYINLYKAINWLCDELCGLEIRSNDFLIRIVCFLRPKGQYISAQWQRLGLKKVIILTVREGFQFNTNIFLRTE